MLGNELIENTDLRRHWLCVLCRNHTKTKRSARDPVQILVISGQMNLCVPVLNCQYPTAPSCCTFSYRLLSVPSRASSVFLGNPRCALPNPAAAEAAAAAAAAARASPERGQGIRRAGDASARTWIHAMSPHRVWWRWCFCRTSYCRLLWGASSSPSSPWSCCLWSPSYGARRWVALRASRSVRLDFHLYYGHTVQPCEWFLVWAPVPLIMARVFLAERRAWLICVLLTAVREERASSRWTVLIMSTSSSFIFVYVLSGACILATNSAVCGVHVCAYVRWVSWY